MPIVSLHGHESLQQRLLRAKSTGSFPSALLLHGPPGIGKQRVALWAAQLLLCESGSAPCLECEHCRFAAGLTHPDLRWIFPRPRAKDPDPSAEVVERDYADAIARRVANGLLYEPPSGSDGIYISTVRAIVRRTALAPSLARRKVFVVGDAERMVQQQGSEFAANAFLKVLEEPPENTTFLLTSSEPGALLPTIRSRVVSLRAAPLDSGAMSRFLGDPAVLEHAADRVRRVREDAQAMSAFVRAGAPGRLLAAEGASQAYEAARALLAACRSGSDSEMIKLAFAFGTSGARAGFSDVLDALSELVHSDMRAAAEEGDAERAMRATAGVMDIEAAKQHASGNITPQLIAIQLARSLRSGAA